MLYKNMKYLALLMILAVTITFIYFIFKDKADLELVKICQNRNTSECKIADLPYNNSNLSIEKRTQDLLKRMTLQEKIGQMMLIERKSLKNNNDIALYGLGGLLSGMGSKPTSNTPEAWLAMVTEYGRISKTARLGIPILYGVDAIHGHSNIEQATIFPHFIGLGATGDKDLVKKIALATTEELAATGIYWNFSPNVDVLGDPRWGRFYESFGSDPLLAADLGRAYVEGIGSYDADAYRPIGTAKHFLGAGAMVWGKSYNKNFKLDQGESLMSEEELRDRHLPSFKAAVDSGVSSVMIGLNSWQGKKISENKTLITDTLKSELGFEGFVVSDWYGVYEIDQNKYTSVVKAINAGIDMVMLPFEYERFMNDVYRAVARGDISQERIDDAVTRILRVKFQTGLFDNSEADAKGLQIIGSKEHRELAREAVGKSLVILKNKEQLLPLAKTVKKIYVAGEAAHNLGMQMGGWSVEWQGIDGNWTTGTTILEGFKEVATSGVEIYYNKDGNFNKDNSPADVGIAVVGEKPYAEGWGDKEDLSLQQEDLKAIENLKRSVKKVIVVIISGRSLNIKNEMEKWDAAVSAWLPGSEGGGVADAIFGRRRFTGSLPIDWEL